MDKSKLYAVGLIAALVLGGYAAFFGGGTNVIERVVQAPNTGAFSGNEILEPVIFYDSLNYHESVADVTAATTLTDSQSGGTFYLGGNNATSSGVTVTLPSVTAAPGQLYIFYNSTDATTTNYIIDSAEGDNIDGSLLVNGADVNCVDVDQINVVYTADTIGDFFSVRSDGTQWWIGASNAAVAGSLTCTDPS